MKYSEREKAAQTKRTKIDMVWVQLDWHKPPSEQPYDFIDTDFTFLDGKLQPSEREGTKKTVFVRIRWRTQKNKNNGETKLFALAKDDRLCPVGAAWRIQAQFEHLR